MNGDAPVLTAVQRGLRAYATELELAVGDTLSRDMAERCIGVVLRGQLSLLWEQDVKRSGIAMLAPGDWFGEHNLFLGDAPASLQLRALGFARVLTIPADRLHALLAEKAAPVREQLYREVSASLAVRLTLLAGRLHQRIHSDTKACVLATLREAAGWPSAMSHPEGTLVRVPQKLVAQQIGCSRITISRALSRLSAAGEIRREGRRILLLGHQGRVGQPPRPDERSL
jgi:CRP-like cAMP-binding protein